MWKLTLPMLLAAVPLAAQVRITQGTNQIDIAIDGKPYSTYFYGPEVAKPYLYPLRAPSGTPVTRSFPMANVEGESTDHPHQRSLWFAHSRVNGYDYWNNEFSYKGDKLGHIFITKITKAEGGPKIGEIDSTASWTQSDGKVILIEDRKMIFHSGGPDRVIDFDFTLTAKDTATFQDEKDGVFGLRLAAALEELNAPGIKDQPITPERTGIMTCAEGRTKESNCWGTRANWMDVSGAIAGEKLGVAIFDHPDNPGHPTYWHARGYGLFAANIFGRNAFTGKREPPGDVTLKPGESMHFRYRVVIHPGPLVHTRMEDLYKAYAAGR